MFHYLQNHNYLMINNIYNKYNMNLKIEDYINYHVLFMTICILIAYEYIMNGSNIIIEKKIKDIS